MYLDTIVEKLSDPNIKNGDVIMLDASTSAYALLPFLPKFKDLFIITSGAKTFCIKQKM